MKEYSVWLHWKQGDEFADLLKESKNNLSKTFKLWAKVFKEREKYCLELSKKLKDSKIKGYGDTHHIGLTPKNKKDEELLDKLVKEELIQVDDFEEDEV